MKKWIADLLYITLILAVIVFMIFTVKFYSGNAKECLANPISYFEGINEGAFCSCIKDGVTWPNTVETYGGEINYSNFIIEENK